jgi:sulfatase maturation enzyme AslB (radical SAM superfamily)
MELYEYLQNSVKISVIGGEPTVCKDYDIIMQLIRRVGGSKTKIVTNGHLIKDKIFPYIDCFKEIQISIDASNAEIYNKVRPSINTKYNWANLIDNIDYIIKNNTNIDIKFIFLINGYNYKYIPDMINLAIEYNIKHVFIYEVFNIIYNNVSDDIQDILNFTHKYPEAWRSYAELAISVAKNNGINVTYVLQSLGMYG